MVLLMLWNFMRGYVIIAAEGVFAERFINICIRRQIFLWDVKRENNAITMKMSIIGFKMLRPVAKKSFCKVRILKKVGLPFILNRNKNRKTFYIGILVCMVAFFVSMSYIWEIEISGNKSIDSGLILSELKGLGIERGVLKYKIDAQKAANLILINNDEISWINVVVKGTKVKVELSERGDIPRIIPENIPCNLVAVKDGIVKSILTKEGMEKVKIGDTIIKGQILISGQIESKNEAVKIKPVHAMGVVKARIWYEEDVPLKTEIVNRKRTGNKKEQIKMVLFGNMINLFVPKIEYNDYDIVENVRKVSILNDIVFPVQLITDTIYEVNGIKNEISSDEAKQVAISIARDKILKKMPVGSEKVKETEKLRTGENGEIIVCVIFECIEEIGMEKEMSR